MRKLFLLIFSFIFLFSVHSFPSLEPSIKIGLDDSSFELNNNLSSVQMISVALEYSLCPLESEEGQSCLKKYLDLEKSAVKEFSSLKKIDAAEQLLAFMYETALFKYKKEVTKINVTLLTGEYNCVTASVLYCALAKSLGIDVYGQETTLHAFCSVYIDGQKIDVETTNPYGFNPGVKKTVAQTQNSRKYAVVPKKYYSGHRQIMAPAMATLTGKNVASDLNDQDDYETAIPLEVSRLRFLQKADDAEVKTAKEDLDTLVCNYAITLNKQQKTQEAFDYVLKVIDTFGTSDQLQRTLDNAVYNSAVNMLNEYKDEEALSYFESNKEYMSPAMAQKTEKMISSQILKNKEIEIHNQVVPLFNAGEYIKVKEILEEALKENPSSLMLKKDLQLVNRALGLK